MTYLLEKVSIDSFYGINLLNLLKILEKVPRIVHTSMDRNEPCLPGEIVIWETSNDVKMPDEMKYFYLSNNGFKLTWSYVFGQDVLPVGLIHVSNLKELALVPHTSKKESGGVFQVGSKYFLSLGIESQVFHLSTIDNESRTCLVYVTKTDRPSIWLSDENQNWHYLAANFMDYIRMAIVHVGIPFWQFCFTPEGVPSWVEQVILMEFPHLAFRRPYDIQHRKDLLSESKKHKKKINIINKEMFSPKTPHNVTLDDMMRYHKKNLEKYIRR